MKTEQISLSKLDNRNVMSLIQTSREGVDLTTFDDIAEEFPFNLSEWSRILHLSERTIQRYRKDKKRFNSIHTDRLLHIIILLNKGIEVFGNKKNFTIWLNSENIALGSSKPMELLDNSFGLNLVTNELVKIEYGVLA